MKRKVKQYKYLTHSYDFVKIKRQKQDDIECNKLLNDCTLNLKYINRQAETIMNIENKIEVKIETMLLQLQNTNK